MNKLSNNIEKMSAGRLKIEVLPAGAIVDACHILDGVDKGVIEMGQWWAHYAIGKSPAAGLFTSPLGGAATGLAASALLVTVAKLVPPASTTFT